MLASAREVVLTRGYADTTMLDLAQSAGASKETLYRWFGSKSGLMSVLISDEGEATLHAVRAALDRPDDEPHTVLGDFGTRLLTLLVGPWSLMANRAAMTDHRLGDVLRQHGRYRVGTVVQGYLAEQQGRGRLAVPEPSAAFGLLYGLIVQDTQIRVLLGEDPPDARAVRQQAIRGVEAFLLIHGPDR